MLAAQHNTYSEDDDSQNASQWLYQTLDDLPTAAAVVDTSSHYLYANRRWLRLFRLNAHAIIGEHHFAVFPDLGDDWQMMFQRCLDEGIPYTVTLPFTLGDDTVKHLRWDIMPWNRDNETTGGLLLYVNEVTEAQQVDQSRSTDEAYNRMLMDYASDAIFISDAADNYVDVNVRASELLGYSRDELLQMTIGDLVAPESIADQPLRLDELHSGKAILNERLLVHRDGRRIPVEVNARRLPDGRIMAIVRDITERKQNELDRLEKERLLAALAQQKELSALKTTFMTRVSHEFRTPLAIIGVSSFLLNKHFDTMDADKRAGHLEKINFHVDELGRLLDDVLMVLRAEDHSLVFNPESVDVVTVFQDTFETLRVTYRTKRPIEFTHGDNLHDIAIDQHLLQHILMNLLTNAIKFSPDGQPVQVQVWQEGQNVVFTVRDEGIGIPEDSLDKIFDAYYRAPNVDDISGTGLGLRIVNDCVNRHEGQISVESVVGEGTIFTVALPIAPLD